MNAAHVKVRNKLWKMPKDIGKCRICFCAELIKMAKPVEHIKVGNKRFAELTHSLFCSVCNCLKKVAKKRRSKHIRVFSVSNVYQNILWFVVSVLKIRFTVSLYSGYCKQNILYHNSARSIYAENFKLWRWNLHMYYICMT